jgi:hypothetical protein
MQCEDIFSCEVVGQSTQSSDTQVKLGNIQLQIPGATLAEVFCQDIGPTQLVARQPSVRFGWRVRLP